LYGISILFSFIVCTVITAKYVWPSLRSGPLTRSLRPLLLLHGFRFIGLAFLIPGVAGRDLPIAFAQPAAYGDFIAAVLALISFAFLHTRMGIMLVWLFNLWGTTDLIYAFYEGYHVSLEPGQLGATYFIITVLVPLLIITHALIFRLLLTNEKK
jgi:hypothetical protein